MPFTTTSPCSPFKPPKVSVMDLGWPGKLMIKHLPRMTATCLDKIAVGTKRRLICRICSPKPGISLSATASVASGVTSRGEGPVPPVVKTKAQPASTSSIKVWLIRACSSGMRRGSKCKGFCRALPSHSCKAGRPLSSYTPPEARSLMETMPMRTGSKASTRVIHTLFLGL